MAFYSIFEVYLAHNWPDIAAGKPVLCEVQSSADAATHVVKALIAESAEKLPSGEELRIKTEDGDWKRERWVIKILEELDPDEVELPAPPPVTLTQPIYGTPTAK